MRDIPLASGSKRAPVGFKLAAAGLTVVSCEVLCAAAFHWLLENRDFVRRDFTGLRELVTTQHVRRFGSGLWDRELGWSYKPGMEDTEPREGGGTWHWSIAANGARADPCPFAESTVSAYGDSYAFCAQVDDDQTWEYELSRLAGSHVLNFGVSAYGTDQAVWKMERTLPEHRTDVVVLVVLSEDVARLLCSYRPFYSRSTGLLLGFKPMLIRTAGGFTRLPDPLVRAESREDFLRAYEIATHYDYWYRRNERKVRVRFPYTLSLLRAIRYSLLDGEETNLFEHPEARDRMLEVLHEFVALSRRYRFRPVALFIPVPHELRAFADGRAPSYRSFVARLREDRALGDLTVVDLLEHEFDLKRFNNRPFRGHASPYGNRVIARVLYGVIGPKLGENSERRLGPFQRVAGFAPSGCAGEASTVRAR